MVVMKGLENVCRCGVQLSSGVVPYGCYCCCAVAVEGALVDGFRVSFIGT